MSDIDIAHSYYARHGRACFTSDALLTVRVKKSVHASLYKTTFDLNDVRDPAQVLDLVDQIQQFSTRYSAPPSSFVSCTFGLQDTHLHKTLLGANKIIVALDDTFDDCAHFELFFDHAPMLFTVASLIDGVFHVKQSVQSCRAEQTLADLAALIADDRALTPEPLSRETHSMQIKSPDRPLADYVDFPVSAFLDAPFADAVDFFPIYNCRENPYPESFETVVQKTWSLLTFHAPQFQSNYETAFKIANNLLCFSRDDAHFDTFEATDVLGQYLLERGFIEYPPESFRASSKTTREFLLKVPRPTATAIATAIAIAPKEEEQSSSSNKRSLEVSEDLRKAQKVREPDEILDESLRFADMVFACPQHIAMFNFPGTETLM